MRIGFVLDDTLDSTDGVQQYVLTVGSWLFKQGHEVHYLVGESCRNDIPNLHSLAKNFKVHFNKNKMSTPLPSSTVKLKQTLKELDLDILHIQMPYSPFFGGKLVRIAKQMDTPVVATFHILPASNLEKYSARALFWLQKGSIRHLGRVISVSMPAKQFIEQSLPHASEIIPNPVDVQKFARKNTSKEQSGLTLTFLGRLVQRKGCKEFVRALDYLYQKGFLNDVHVNICGDGDLRRELEDYVKVQGLGTKISFLGYLSEEEKVKQLHKTDIAVFPSLGGESFGIVLIEAMAAGCSTVLAGDNAGYRYVMDDNKRQLVNPLDTEAFAKCILGYINDSKKRSASFAWQQARIKRFDIGNVGAEIESIYRAEIAKNKQEQHNKGKSRP